MEIKYEQLNLIGMELFRKNNSTFLKSPLSPMMDRIFKAANGIVSTDSEFYMKSGAIPNRIYYIYSDQLLEKDPDKIFDVIYFNGEKCVWFYSKNVINKIDENPIDTIFDIYDLLISVFMPYTYFNSFLMDENKVANISMCMNLILFLNETYGVLDIDLCKKLLIEKYLDNYTEESAKEFVEDIASNCSIKNYFNNREYLDSMVLLKRRLIIRPV